ncbi:MAG: YtxH domain-containing protein, partial [Nitrospira sp.]|nr:YtxH domain-containing protein [Nitrospira sp.]
MERQNTECSASPIALAFLGGAIVGGIVGLLLAPKSGVETRRTIKGYADKTEEEIVEMAKEARAALDETI